ncbi:MAG: M20/M25/M40 family metallo-hydrolase, partial [Planctomycetota bacterium]|jgi:acetylornithine deacetylase/succinyl-diaminopimelate desuccinylase-like protein
VPHLLYYGHYDVQPPDPLDLWDSPPFEPTIVEGPHGRRLVARGAVDDKGQLMTFVEAFRAWHDVHGTLPVKVTVLLEGEEESGSPSLDPFLSAHREMLAADVCIVSDTGMWDIDTPAITYMLRGMVYVEVTLHGPSHDLHSGMYGGAVVNPANELPRILGELHDAQGVVQIPGFYDDVLALSADEARQWAQLTFDEAAFLGHAGLETPVGETGRSTLQRIWSRPCCDINGIFGGYTGDGAKTIIPAKATAKVSCRLVPDQDADKIHDNIVRFFEQRTPPDCRWEIRSHGASPAVRVPTDSPHLEAALQALETTYGRQPVLMGCGGSIPVVGSIQRILGFDSLLVGFSLDDDRVHSPNEKFELRCYEMGMRSHAAMLSTFSALAGTPTQTSAAR